MRTRVGFRALGLTTGCCCLYCSRSGLDGLNGRRKWSEDKISCSSVVRILLDVVKGRTDGQTKDERREEMTQF
jgi:hypothetical protein